MDGLTSLFAGLLASLRALAPEGCLGGWPWAVSALGIGVGLLPTVGAVLVALLRRWIGSRYGFTESTVLIGAGVLTAGLFPLLVFTVVGRVFSEAAVGVRVAGLGRADLRDLATSACDLIGIGSQAEYLGSGSVRSYFDTGDLPRLVFAVALLAAAPLVTSMFVAAQAHLALRRGPKWPSKFFWLPVLAVAFLTAGVPAGTAGHLWAGAVVGSFVGILIVLLFGKPSREVVRRSRSVPEPRAARPPGPPPTSDRVAVAPLARGPQAPIRPLHTPTFAAVAPPFPVAAPIPPGGAPRFRLIRRLGSGGFGRVWLAHDARLGHLVALKAAHAPDAETEQRIQREARALAAVRHPHCVRIHDLVPARSDPGLADLEGMVIVMGYVEGSSLGELIRGNGVLDDVAAARVWASVAGALDAAHHRGVLHRDVKPGNVVVDPGGLAHLIDFGIARKTGDATMTLAGFVLGTPDFLSPEVACGERATPASDSWQLAATVAYALTGHPPRGVHSDAVSGLRAAASGAPLSHLPRRSAHLALLRAALDTDPAARPALHEVQQALGEWLRRIGARPGGPVAAGTRVL